MNRLRKPYMFGFLYGVILVLSTSYVLLDTFVIPRSYKTTVDHESNNESSNENDNTSNNESNIENNNSNNNNSNNNSNNNEGTYTANSYTDDNISITITESTVNDTKVYIADIEVSDISYLKTAFAKNSYGRNIKETTSTMAENNNAILAINGDFYGFRDEGYVIRNGVLYRSESNNTEDLVIMEDGSFQIVEEEEASAQSLLDAGAWQVLSFGPALVMDGEVSVNTNTEVAKAKTSNPRTAIGMISPLHYVIVVSDGRTDESEGLTLYELAGVMEDAGCQVAYNLDGGGSSTLYFNGEVVNNPTDGRNDGERSVSDIVYIGY